LDINLPVVVLMIIDGLVNTNGSAVVWVDRDVTLLLLGSRSKSTVGTAVEFGDLGFDPGTILSFLALESPLWCLDISVTESASITNRVGSPELAVQATERSERCVGVLNSTWSDTISTT